MKKAIRVVLVCLLLTVLIQGHAQFPQAVVDNGIIKARFYLPDSVNGYYRAARFDWSGLMPELECNGHSYFGQWFENYSPTLHEAVMGPVEDFTPIGYDEAKSGDKFLKIGVGMLIKPQEPRYFIVTPYQNVNSGVWRVKASAREVRFEHKLADEKYGYTYTKTVSLVRNKPQMVIMHTIENTGKTTIATDVYDHNFFVIDQQLTGPGFVVKFPFEPRGQPLGNGPSLGGLTDSSIIFSKELNNNEHLQYLSLTGFSNVVKDYDIRVENQNSGAGVHITSDQPLAKLSFWSAIKTVCPEPFVKFSIKPGERFSWKIYYEFYQCTKQ